MAALEFRRGIPKKTYRYSNFVDLLDVDSVEEAIGFEPLTQTGEEDTGYCPDFWGLHTNGDTTGKFSINREKRVYNCWVCGGGSFLDLAMHTQNLDQEAAEEWLHQFVEGELDDDQIKDRLKQRLYREAKGEKAPLPFFNERVLDRWLTTDHPWLEERGITEEVAREYRLGFNPEAMKRPPKKGKYEDEEPYVGPAIVLPHFFGGKLVGWQHRWLDDDRPEFVKKYTNTSDFPKDETIFNYDAALRAQQHPVVVVESVPSVLFIESCGIPAVALFGGTITDTQKKLLRRFHQGVLIGADNDKAGIKSRAVLTRYLKDFIPVEWAPLVGEEGSKDDLGDLDMEDLYDHLERSFLPVATGL